MKDVHIDWADVKPGDSITVNLNPKGWSGQGGTVQTIDDTLVTLKCGTAGLDRTIFRTEAHHVTKEVPFDAEECLDYYSDDCRGAVEMFSVGNSRSWPRCAHHRDRRQASYDSPNSVERYADCTVPPDWFDPSYAGESWDGE